MSKGRLSRFADYMVNELGMDEKKVSQMDSEDFLEEALAVVAMWSDISVSMQGWIKDIADEIGIDPEELKK